MKNFLLFIFLPLLLLLGAKNMDDSFGKEKRMEVENVLRKDMPEGYVLSSVSVLPDGGDACVDTESLARQYRICGRGQRTFSAQHLSLGKSSAYRASKKHLEMFLHTIHCVYTSLPCQSWKVSSDHYVCGMRRILI